MQSAIKKLGVEKVRESVVNLANRLHVEDAECLLAIFNCCVENPDLCPDKQNKKGSLSCEERILKWVQGFDNDYNERISKHRSNLPHTIADDSIRTIVKAGLPNISVADSEKIVYAHRLAMSAENIQGLLLEEYICDKLRPYGWYMAWGKTIKSVDFCSKRGNLLQIKNQDNTENSSSSKVRVGTEIHKWFRRKSASGETQWPTLEAIAGCPHGTLSEKGFQDFIIETLRRNPAALAIEPQNPWRNVR